MQACASRGKCGATCTAAAVAVKASRSVCAAPASVVSRRRSGRVPRSIIVPKVAEAAQVSVLVDTFFWPSLHTLAEMKTELDAIVGRETISQTVDFTLSEEAVKKVVLFLSLLFSWGCIYFGSLEEPFYAEDSEYRKEGGDGSSNWFYTKDEEAAVAERAKLAAAASSESQADDSASTASS